MTSNKVSLTKNSEELLLRDNAARLLAKIVLSNDHQSYPKLKHNLLTVLTKELMTQLGVDLTNTQHSIIYGIFTFFSYMDSQSIYNYLYQPVLEFIKLVEQGKIVSGLSASVGSKQMKPVSSQRPETRGPIAIFINPFMVVWTSHTAVHDPVAAVVVLGTTASGQDFVPATRRRVGRNHPLADSLLFLLAHPQPPIQPQVPRRPVSRQQSHRSLGSALRTRLHSLT